MCVEGCGMSSLFGCFLEIPYLYVFLFLKCFCDLFFSGGKVVPPLSLHGAH